MKRHYSTKKVLIYNTSFFAVSETFIYHQVKALSEEYEIHLIASKFLNPQNYDDPTSEKINIHRSRGFINRVTEKFLNTRLFDIKSYQAFKKIFRENRYKAIHAHYGTKAVEILPIAKWYKVPLVVSFHGADASRTLQIEQYRKKLPALFDYASDIIISSEHMAENLDLEDWSDKVHVIPYGVNLSEFNVYDEPNIPTTTDQKIKILHVGRIVGKKGVPDLIKVFEQLSRDYKHLELHLAGDGEEMEECRKLVEHFGLNGKVQFYGSVTHSKVRELLEEADIFVLNSRIDAQGDMEGTPNTILEAMCMGKPVVSTRHAGIPFVIEHGENGLLADERDNRELKNAIERMISDPELRKQLGTEARKTILESYSLDGMKEKIQKVFKDLP